jgi:hypothetical protein
MDEPTRRTLSNRVQTPVVQRIEHVTQLSRGDRTTPSAGDGQINRPRSSRLA